MDNKLMFIHNYDKPNNPSTDIFQTVKQPISLINGTQRFFFNFGYPCYYSLWSPSFLNEWK